MPRGGSLGAGATACRQSKLGSKAASTKQDCPPSLSLFTTPPFSALRPLRGPERDSSVHRLAEESREPERSAPILPLSGRSGGQAVGSLG
jgi:hypothetical protein